MYKHDDDVFYNATNFVRSGLVENVKIPRPRSNSFGFNNVTLHEPIIYSGVFSCETIEGNTVVLCTYGSISYKGYEFFSPDDVKKIYESASGTAMISSGTYSEDSSTINIKKNDTYVSFIKTYSDSQENKWRYISIEIGKTWGEFVVCVKKDINESEEVGSHRTLLARGYEYFELNDVLIKRTDDDMKLCGSSVDNSVSFTVSYESLPLKFNIQTGELIENITTGIDISRLYEDIKQKKVYDDAIRENRTISSDFKMEDVFRAGLAINTYLGSSAKNSATCSNI